MGTILPESLEREIAALTTDEKRALATMRVLLQSKLGRDTWLAYAEGMADGASL